MHRRPISRRALAALAAAALGAGYLTAAALPAGAAPGDAECGSLDSGIRETYDDGYATPPLTVTYRAPAGQAAVGYCVAAGGVHLGEGPVYVRVDPTEVLTFAYPGDRGITHYTVDLEPLELTAVYLYELLDPTAGPSWGNSGRQTLLTVEAGHVDPAIAIPGEVCGDGWAVQVDHLRGLASDAVPAVIDRTTGEGVLGWPPVVAALHHSLSFYGAVPACEVPPTEPPVEEPPVAEPPAVTPPATAPEPSPSPAPRIVRHTVTDPYVELPAGELG